jgi:glycogen operon protein
MDPRAQPGRSSPLGATVYPQGVNFSVFSKGSTRVELMLFDGVDDARPSAVIPLDPPGNRTYHYLSKGRFPM